MRLIPALTLLASVPAANGAEVAGGTARVDPLVVIVSAHSTVTEISRLHLADLYMGRTNRLPNGSPALPIDQRQGSPARVTFSQTFLGRSEAQIKAHWSKIIFTGRGRPPAEATSAAEVRNRVAADARAIGYLDSGLVDSTVRVVRVHE